MLLTDYFRRDWVVRDGDFLYTMPVYSDEAKSICYATNTKFIDIINRNRNISCVIVNRDVADKVAESKGLVVCSDPGEQYYRLHNHLISSKVIQPLVVEPYISPTASIHPTACIASRVHIEDNVRIGPFVVIEEDTIIRKGCYIAHNVVIGCKGMQNVKMENRHMGILYCGGVSIGEYSEVLSNAIIQKPYQKFFTEIAEQVQISVKVSVGHGSKIGKNSQLAGNVTIAGNVKIGENVWIGPSSTIADDISVGSNAKILLGSVVTQGVPSGVVVSGNFAQRHEQQLKNYVKIKKL